MSSINLILFLVFLKAGKGYNLSKHVLTPVAEPANDSETSFNEAHTKIHDVMRTTLGSMKRRFTCLNQLGFAQENSLGKKSNIIKACSVLHNIAKKFSVPPPSDAGQIEPLHPGKQRAEPDINPEALKARQKLIIANFLKVSSTRNPPSKGIAEEVVRVAGVLSVSGSKEVVNVDP
nr:putative nuclease HARBI1 [Labrus bergylta]